MKVELLVHLKIRDGSILIPGRIFEDPLPREIKKEIELCGVDIGRRTVRIINSTPTVVQPEEQLVEESNTVEETSPTVEVVTARKVVKTSRTRRVLKK